MRDDDAMYYVCGCYNLIKLLCTFIHHYDNIVNYIFTE